MPVLTLRARPAAQAPTQGMLMASADGTGVYRVLSVTRVWRPGCRPGLAEAGAPEQALPSRGLRWRIVCERLRRAELPLEGSAEAARIRPWIGADSPRGAGRAGQGAPAAEAGVRPTDGPPADRAAVVVGIRRRRAEEGRAAVARAARVGRDLGVIDRADFGPGILLQALWERGRRLRGPEVAVEHDVAEPDRPNRRMRRARRVDPLDALARVDPATGRRTIDRRQYEAAERLRDDAERAEAMTGGAGFGEAHVDCSLTTGRVDLARLKALAALRCAIAAMRRGADGELACTVVTWVVLGGGTIEGYARHARMRRAAVPALLCAGLDRLADHYFGACVGAEGGDR
jgi:hypothetical protein